VAIATVHGDLLWLDGGWPGSCHEQGLTEAQRASDRLQAGLQALVEQAIGHLANA
jgi:hypothetical protein